MTEIDSTTSVLRWRIPEGRGQVSLRFALVRIAFVTVIVGILVLFLTPPESHAGLMSAAITIALVMAAVQAFRASREAALPANVWLDDAGLHWLDGESREQLLPRSLARSFLIGRDDETRRDLASLAFLLEGGFLSQPIELHAPAEPDQVRRWLVERWAVSEASSVPTEEFSTKVYSELDHHNQRWLLEGSRQQLAELGQALANTAQWPLPPTGARPKQLDLLFDGQSITLAVSAHTWLDGWYFSASPGVLRTLAEEIGRQLAAAPPREEFEIPLTMDSGHQWKIICDIGKQ